MFVEAWLTEEEYQDAKEKKLLSWQDTSNSNEGKEKISVDTSAAVRLPSSLFLSLTQTNSSIHPLHRRLPVHPRKRVEARLCSGRRQSPQSQPQGTSLQPHPPAPRGLEASPASPCPLLMAPRGSSSRPARSARVVCGTRIGTLWGTRLL